MSLLSFRILDNNVPLFILYEVCLLSVCLCGDYYLQFVNTAVGIVAKNDKLGLWSRAFIDSLTHGLVGLFSCAVVVNFTFKGVQVIPLLLCFSLAIAVDVDHFLAAKSLEIQDALNLSKRPPFHGSTVILLVSGTAWILGYLLDIHYSKVFSLLFLTAWLSHHIRDGTRRGLWFPPFGSTPPIPYSLYITLILLLPIIVRYIYICSCT